MASSSSRSVLAAAVSVLLLFATASDARLLHRVGHVSEYNPCGKSSYLTNTEFYPEFCHSVASTGSFTTDKDFAVAAMSKAVDELNAGVDAAGKAIEAEPTTATGRRGYLRNCQGFYGQAIGELEDLRGQLIGNGSSIKKYSLSDIRTLLSAALTDVDTCSTEWGEASFEGSFPIKEVDAHLNKVLLTLFPFTTVLE